MSHPLVDAVIVSYNSAETLRSCVEPLTAMDGVHVVVVDNASPDDPEQTVADLPITYVQSGRNGGFSFGCNVGAAQGTAPYVLFINPDASIDERSLAALRGVLDANPSAALVGPRMLDGDGTLLYTQRRFPRPRRTWSQALFLHRVAAHADWADEMMREPARYDRPGQPDWLSGACLLIRRTALEQIGGWDEGFFLYCEDTDVCLRLGEAGWTCHYEPGAVAAHSEGSSAPRDSLVAVHAESRVRYARKHSPAWSARLDTGGVAVGLATHALTSVLRGHSPSGHLLALKSTLGAGRT